MLESNGWSCTLMRKGSTSCQSNLKLLGTSHASMPCKHASMPKLLIGSMPFPRSLKASFRINLRSKLSDNIQKYSETILLDECGCLSSYVPVIERRLVLNHHKLGGKGEGSRRGKKTVQQIFVQWLKVTSVTENIL